MVESVPLLKSEDCESTCRKMEDLDMSWFTVEATDNMLFAEDITSKLEEMDLLFGPAMIVDEEVH